jgi:hypothetical protein
VTRRMRFSWKALALAPLAIPALYSAAFVLLTPGRNRLMGFVVFAAIGAVLTYGATIVLLLPCLFVLSRVVRLNAVWAGVVGAMLGFALYLPNLWISWNASGVDSGPPTETLAHYVQRNFLSFELPVFVAAGLVTALLYWWLAGRGRDEPRSEAA